MVRNCQDGGVEATNTLFSFDLEAQHLQTPMICSIQLVGLPLKISQFGKVGEAISTYVDPLEE